MTEAKRWAATVWYRGDEGLAAMFCHFEELEELHDIVERGPDWNCIEKIEVRLARATHPGLTVEQAARL